MSDFRERTHRKVYEGFETTSLLDAIDHLDNLRRGLSDDGIRPPQLRDDLLKLHQLAMDYINEGDLDKQEELFDLAFDIGDRIFDWVQSLEAIEITLQNLTAFAPDPDDEYDDDEDN